MSCWGKKKGMQGTGQRKKLIYLHILKNADVSIFHSGSF